MKAFPLLILPVFLTSCGLIQMPARLINQVIAPLTHNEIPDGATPTAALAIRSTSPAESPRRHAPPSRILQWEQDN